MFITLRAATSSAEAARQWRHLLAIKKARECFDARPIIELFAADAVYESQDTLEPLSGKAEIATYLSERFTFIAGFRDTHDTGSLLPAVVDLPAAADHPCLVFEAEGRRRA
ncbi:hypothetical protein OEZ60_21845, partial [Defluviimonas sp. WL0024]